MARPVKVRTAKSYTRDIETLGRLRTAILMDKSVDAVLAGDAIAKLDQLVKALIPLTTD